MDQLYTWCIAHPLYCTITGIILSIFLSLINLDKVKIFAFTISQLIRKILGRKVEDKIENIVDAFNAGLHSDNERKK